MSDEWVTDVQGNFPLHTAVTKVMPSGTQVISCESSGASAWTKTGKVTVRLPDGSRKRYFLKVASGRGAQSLVKGEYHSASAIEAVVSDFVPSPVGYGEYHNGESQVYFFLGNFHDFDLRTPPDPETFSEKIAQLHLNSKSPTGKFGFPVTTVCGVFERTVKWEESWAECYANLLSDVIRYDKETNGPWPEFEAACDRTVNFVIPRLLGALQSDGRSIEPVLIHGDLWEQNIGLDMESGHSLAFDAGCVYAHNELEFGTWRCSWAYYFNLPAYQMYYRRYIQPSEPASEWDDRNRLYSMHIYLNDSAGHPGSLSRKTAYNDMLFLCEKYAPLETLEKYDPAKDISLTGAFIQHETHTLNLTQANVQS
ncbi:Fructosamine kinase-domain-containing protein [Aspergillus stella-maris]|uniref:Fructosamine kinase-domain-containing protein n=1 Tax=Aspergillus stella-maris TaxID=1810926 RepID=UPI003CCDECD3